ncbi:hypothetical protein PsYK624_057460 [Phanerochaete sordida]|uniref:Uncharacterized protein n=1 Tax=Phanerochaete sordida TaxID=48140 RepID=A0A9P3G7S6_9APHY|nr:hypothetical protein PsYK624_057460 [Phanerochaete sordida]
MALLGLFAKRDKKDKASSKSSAASQADSSSVAETSEYVLPDIGVPAMPNQVYGHGSAEASSSKFHLGFRKRSTPASDVAEPNLLRPPHMPSPSSRSEADLDALRPPLKANLFADQKSTLSTRSLPNHSDQPSGTQEMQDGATKRPSTELPSAPKKQGGLFSWAHRERKKSKPTDAAPSLSVDLNTESFNLKSFRHVRPESPSPDSSLAGSPSLAPPVIPRPRGNSVASDSSQRISVAAFREMAARRSAANSPTPSPVLLRPPSRSDSLENAQLRPTSTFQRAPVAHRGSTLALGHDSSSSESEDSGESESEESAGSSTMRPKRQRTITQKTRARASTELGHISRPAPVPMPSSSKSALGHGEDASGSGQPQRPPAGGFFRNRASKSASALHPDAAARRASQMAADEEKPKVATPAPVRQQRPYVKVLNQPRSKSRVRDSDSDDSNSSSDDSDDAPLATFMRPPRPGSAASSNASRTRTPTKPLIDINALGATPPPVPSLPRSERPSPAPSVPEKLPTPPAMDRDSGGSSSSDLRSGSRPTHEAKPSLSDRLARIAQGAGAKSVEQLASATPIERRSLDARPTLTTADSHERERERHHRPPSRSQTAPLGSFDDRAGSPSPSTSRPRPSPNAAAAYDLTDPKPIIPTPIRERSPPPAFTVTSRPPSQLSLNRLSNSQATVKLISSPSSSPTTSLYMGATSSTSSGPTVLTDSPVSMSKPSPFTFMPPIKTTLPPTPPASAPSSARPSPGGRQRSSTLVPTGSFENSAGFTGGGLLASPASSDTKNSNGASRQSQPQSAMRGGRARSSTMLPQMDVSPAPRMDNQSTASSGSSRMPPSTSSASATSASVSTSSQQQSAAHRLPQRARPPFGGSPSSAGSMSSLQQPSKPFAVTERGNSPASSTGDSSSGRTPLTPADGSDLGVRQNRSAVGARKGHRRGPSVTFEDEDNERGRPGAKTANDEERRKERRRSEAKAAIELGKVVNGKITLEDDDEEDMPLNSLGPRMSMAANPMMNFTPPTPVTPWGGSPGASPMMGAPPFLMQPPNADPRFLAAHQHAMMVAKQAYQMAVAQQAMAAANEEWERGSSVSAFGGGMNMNMGMGMGGMPGMAPMAGMGMPGMMPGGYGMGFNPMMFSSAQTMYAGSTAGSELGVGWGSRSEYGGPTRNNRTSAAYSNRQSQFGLSPDKRSESSGNIAAGNTRPAQRPRTKTSPADAPLPRDHPRNRQGPPPSSFKPL